MSSITVSMSDETESQNAFVREQSSHIIASEKQEKNNVPGERNESFSHNLQTNLVHESSGFTDNNVVELNETGVMKTSSMILSQDDRVMYISAEGSVSFNPKNIASTSRDHMAGRSVCLEGTSSMSPNYLVVVENARATQALSSDFERSIPLSSETCDPHTNSSMAPACSHTNGLKSADADIPDQQAIMVFDGQLQSDSILIDPNVLVAYDHSSGEQISFSTDPSLGGPVRSLPEVCQGPFIHLEQTSIADSIENYTQEKSILQKSTIPHSYLSAHTIMVAKNPLSVSKDSAIVLGVNKEITSFKEEKEFGAVGRDDSKLLQQKEELKLLEKYHLQHHKQEAKKKMNKQSKTHSSQTFIEDKRKKMIGEIPSHLQEAVNSTSLLSKEVGDEISVSEFKFFLLMNRWEGAKIIHLVRKFINGIFTLLCPLSSIHIIRLLQAK